MTVPKRIIFPIQQCSVHTIARHKADWSVSAAKFRSSVDQRIYLACKHSEQLINFNSCIE